MAKKTVFVQNWEESERGWGVRPDGFTVHISKQQRDSYVKWYNDTFNNEDEAPNEYTRISGQPIEVEVEDGLYDRIKAASTITVDNRTVDCVRGDGNYFSSTPMRPLKDEDIKWRENE